MPICPGAASQQIDGPGCNASRGAGVPFGMARHLVVPCPDSYQKVGYEMFSKLGYPPAQLRFFLKNHRA